MAVTFNATPDVDNACVVINAQGGVTGDRFYMVRRDQNGANLIRETSDTGATWLKDPAKVRTNLATNPSFEATTSSQIARTNLATNPAAASTTNYAAVAGTGGAATLSNVSGSGHTGSTFNRVTWTTATTAVSGGATYIQTGLAANTPYAMSLWVKSTKAQTIALKADFQTSASAIVNTATATGVAVQANTWTQLFVTGTSGASVDRVLLTAYASAGVVWAVNDTFDVDDVLIENGVILNPNFDGSTTNTGDWLYTWSGTANASTSFQSIAGATGVNATSVAAGSSGAWSMNGVRSLRLTPTSTSSNDSYGSPGGDVGGLRLGLTPGKVYTISATLRLAGAQAGTVHGMARKIVAFNKVGTGAYTSVSSAAAANGAGSTRLSLTFSVPSGATEAFIRLYNGAYKDNGEVWWDSFLLEEEPILRTNWATNPESVGSATGFGVYSAGTGETGTSTFVTGAADGPIPAITTYSRRTVTAPKTGGSTGWLATAGSYRAPVTGGVAGDTVTESLWIRSSVDITVGFRAITYNSVGTSLENLDTTYNLVAGQWTRMSATLKTTMDYGSLGWWAYMTSGYTLPANATMDVTGWLAEKSTFMDAYFSGDTVNDATYKYTWAGTQDASATFLTSAPLRSYFDGDSNKNTAWTGTAHASTSTDSSASLPITLHDYEARQGMDCDYIITDENGMTSDSKRISIPKWGTWIKDPFRPFMNVKVMWNADSEYARPVERVILKARGAKFPVVQHERRMAPNGTVRIVTETNDVSKRLIALFDMTNIVMLDVDADFGVPVRYVSVGDLSGKRAGKEDTDLSWEARYWDLPIQEVAPPVGAPIAQSLTYDMLAANFGSYIAIPASVDTYNDLSQGVWS